MPETNTPTIEQQTISPELVKEWVDVSDEIADFGQQVAIDRGQGPEEAVLVDILYLRSPGGLTEDRKPVVVIDRNDGLRETIPAEDYLKWTGFDETSFRESVEERNQALHAAEVKKIEEKRQQELGFQAIMAAQRKESEQAELTRTERVFAPIAEKVTEARKSYDYLLDPNYVFPPSSEAAAIREDKNSREYITDENLERAATVLQEFLAKDYVAAGIINKNLGAQKLDGLDLVDRIREDADLRKALGIHFLDKIQLNLSSMPERVIDDRSKGVEYKGYTPELKSREYAALLALSMLDGSFNYDQEQKVQPVNKIGIPEINQHRYAARFLLSNR